MNDKQTRKKNVLWMISAFIIFFLVIFTVCWGVGALSSGSVSFLSEKAGWAITGIALLFSSGFYVAMYALLLRPLDELNAAMKIVAKGEFNVKLHKKSPIPGLKNMKTNLSIMAEELSGSETLRNDLIAGMSHEFKTPLAAIEGYASLLQKGNLSEEKERECIDKIIKNAEILSAMSGNFLQLVKLENQEIVVNRTIFKLDEQIRQVLVMTESKWTEKNLELELDLPKTEYYGNEELVKVIWQNLLSNAIKYTPDGGKIRVSIQKEEKITVTISDTGVGIGKEEMEHIFDKFYRADAARTSEGSGLGLTLVKRVVELCNGTIEVKSAPGKGATFIVRL